MFWWCRLALAALVVLLVSGPVLAVDLAPGDLQTRLEALREQRESRLVHSPAIQARRPQGAQGHSAANDFIVNNDGFIGTANQTQMVVRRQPNGGTVAVWTDDRDGNLSIYGQVFDSLGAPLGSNFRLHADPGNLIQQDPDIAVRSDGGFYGAFTQVDLNGDRDVFVIRYSKLGQRLGAGVAVAPDSTGPSTYVQRRPRLLIMQDGAVLVAFERDSLPSPNSDIRAQLVNAEATGRLGLPLNVSADLVVSGVRIRYDEREPELARGAGDTVWVTWTDNRDGGVRDVFVQRLRRPTSTSLALIGAPSKANDEPVASNAAQKTPVIAVASDGSAHLAWADFRNQHWDIFKASYSSAGVRLGANSRVNFSEATSLDQTEPAIAWLDTSGIVVWKDFRSGVARVYAQKYRFDGTASGVNYAVGSAATTNQSSPDISLGATRAYSVVWTQPEGGASRAYVRYFDAADAGSAAASAAEIVISAQQVRPSTAVGAVGDLFTVWEEARGAGLSNIVGQALNSSLAKPQANQQVNDGPAVLHLVPAVGVGGTAGFAVWEDYRDTIQPVYSDIYIRQFALSATGYVPTGSNVRVIDTTESQEVRLASWNPDVAADAAGNALVVWQDNRLGSWDIFSARYSATTAPGTGNPQRIGANLRLDQSPGFTKQIMPRVDVNETGRSVVVWEDTRNGSYAFQVWARILTGAGAALVGGEVNLNTGPTLVPRQPDVAVSTTGEFAVVFEDHSDPADVDVYLQRFDAAGARLSGALGDPVLLNDDLSGAHQFNVKVAAISGGYVAVWQDERSGDWDIYAGLVANGQSTVNPNYLVNNPDLSDQTSPIIAARRSENNPFICWEDLRVATTAPDIFGNRNPATVATSASDEPGLRPLSTTLEQNFPNPFNPATQIEFVLDRPARVELVVYNTLGQKVRTLISDDRQAGPHSVLWDGTDERGQSLGSGTYFYRLSWDLGEVTRKMTLLR